MSPSDEETDPAERDAGSASEESARRSARPSALRRAGGVLLRLAVGLAVWAVVLLLLVLFFVPGRSRVQRKPSTSRSTIPVTSTSFTNADVCSGCHWQIFLQWSGTMHSLANSDPFYVALYDLANADTGGKAEIYCAASMCHTPAGFLAGENPFPHQKMSSIAKLGVFCDFCHTVSARRGIGDAAYVSSPGRLKRGPYRDAKSPYHRTAYSALHTKSEFCGMCHNVSSPITGLKLETTYDEWSRSRYGKRGRGHRECQECHMEPYSGRAAILGPRRRVVFSHYFTGANAFIPPAEGHRSRSGPAVARLRSAARLSFVRAGRAGNRARLDIKVANVGAGHDLPTGITELRQMWLLITVTSAGKTVYASGALSKDGVLDPQAHLFHTVLGDENDRPVTKVWRATQVLSDRRVPAAGSVTERYAFDLPAGTGVVRVTARLMYRSASQDLVDFVMGKGKMKVPAIEMARSTTSI